MKEEVTGAHSLEVKHLAHNQEDDGSTPSGPTTAYHGSPAIDAILREGLIAAKSCESCPHVWLAKQPGDAIPFGPVVAVDVRGFGPWPVDEDGSDWQACYHGGDIGPERLSWLSACEAERASYEAL